NSVVSEIQADESGVNNLRLKDTQTGDERDLPIDGVFIFVGFVPNNELVPAGVKLNSDGFVVTDEQCATNLAGIYAIGDLREKYARQIVLSCGDGCMAALSAAHYVENRKAKAREEACEI
ncbi:MAG: FAD-dependent oxidoreductase, partial [Desulfobacterales bacterium]|nr:FAD-dependent oxidoreductase [Desulfobacterales bacterium]